jgi:hypothetical protein
MDQKGKIEIDIFKVLDQMRIDREKVQVNRDSSAGFTLTIFQPSQKQ